LGVDALPEQTEKEDGGDRRSEEALDVLEVVVEAAVALGDLLHDRNPDQTGTDHDCRGDTTDIDEVRLALAGAELLVDVDGEEGGAGVEERGQRGHERREQAGDDEAAQTDREQRLHHGGKDGIAEDLTGTIGLERDMDDAFGVERETDHAGDEEDHHGPELQEAAPDGAAAGVLDVFGGQAALHDVLVGTPVPDADDGRGDHHAQPGEGDVGVGTPEGELLRVRFAAFDQLVPAAEVVEAEVGDEAGAEEEDKRLRHLGVHDSAQAAEDRVDTGEDDGDDGADPECVVGRAEGIRQERLEDDGAGVDGDGDLREHVGDQRNDGEDPAGLGIEAPLKELGHRVDAGAVVEGHEYPGQHDHQPCVELPVGLGHAVIGAGAGEADDVLGADVRGKQRAADYEPAHMAAGEEVVFRCFLKSRGPPHDADEQHEVESDDDPVEGLHRIQLSVIESGNRDGYRVENL